MEDGGGGGRRSREGGGGGGGGMPGVGCQDSGGIMPRVEDERRRKKEKEDGLLDQEPTVVDVD